MARYEITSPDGRKFEVTAPDDASQDDVLAYAQSQFGAQAASKSATPTASDYIKQLGASAVESLGTIAQGGGEALAFGLNKATGTENFRAVNPLEKPVAVIRDTMTDAGKRAAQDSAKGDILDPSTWEAPKTAEGWGMLAAQGFGSLSTWVLPGAAAVKARAALEAGDTAMAAAHAARASALGGATGALSTGGDAAGDARESTAKAMAGKTHGQLLSEVPAYAEAFKRYGDEGTARQAVINSAGQFAGLFSGAIGAAEGVVGGKILGGIAQKTGIPGLSAIKSTPARIVAGGLAGAGVEGSQEAAEKVGKNVGENVGQGRPAFQDPTRDTFGEFLGGAIVGKGMGMAGGAVRPASADLRAPTNQVHATPLTATGILGTSEQPGPTAATPSTGVSGGAQQAAQPTEAEKALYSQKSITALDRVAEIDAKLTNDGREVDKAEVDALQTERDSITASWPKAMPGATTSFTTEAGARLDGQYALVEAGDLTTSHDESLRPVATYPAELQPRERERHASEMQIQQIVGRLDPARLGESADVATGAPIVGADGLVESGNARTIALKRVYQANGQKAIDYKEYLKANAGRFGITPESVDAMQKPVLVRVRNTPVNRAEFARQANQATVARMSPSEQARSDAAQIDNLDDLNPTEAGDFSSGASAPFVRRFMAKLPATEQAGLVDSTGQLSQSGYTRIRNAVLAKAYGDSPVLQRMVESLDSNIRNVGTALLRVAPQVAKTREAINEGAMHDADLTPDLMAAVEELSSLKDKGTSVTEALAQAGMFGDKLSAESRTLLEFLDANIRSPRRIAEFIQSYLDALAAAGNPAQGSMFGDTAAPAKVDLIAAARRMANGESTATGGAAAGNSADGQARGEQSQDSQGDQAGARGNETSEWLTFPPDTGTLGIPRAEMPQIKGDHRGALIKFLRGRDINHETVEMPANQLKPTQAEFSPKKVEGWAKRRGDVDRSVLASSDGYILDGHHQWVAALAAGETEKVIRFDAPIQELLSAVREFPSVKKSEGVKPKPKAELRREIIEQQWNDALADLGVILRDFAQVARMVPEDTPNLMPTLVKLFEAGFGKVGMQIGDLMKYVKAELRKIPEFSKVWNKLSPATYRKAAAQALENHQAAPQGDLFAPMVEKAQQGDLFSGKPAEKVGAGKTAQSWEERRKGNYKAPALEEIVPADVAKRVRALVAKWKDNLPEAKITAEERIKAEAMLEPVIAAAQKDEAWFDKRVKVVADEAGIGFQLGPTKKIGRAAIKLVEEEYNLNEMKDIVRATIVVNAYSEAQGVISALARHFKLRQITNKSSAEIISNEGIPFKNKGPMAEGYQDVTVFIYLPGGGTAEVQINTVEMLSAKDAGHVLYEGSRVVKDDPARQAEYVELRDGQIDLYSAADLANRKNWASENDPISDPTGNALRGSNSLDSSLSLKTDPSGNLTQLPADRSSKNSEPGGNLSGTFISTTSTTTIAQEGNPSYTGSGKRAGESNGQSDGNNGSASAQGQSSGSASATDGGGDAAGVRGGPSRGNRRSDRNADNADGAEDGARQGQESDGGRGDTEGMRGDGNGNRAGRDAAIPAGRDIPAKSGLNYAFGDGDLTYSGSWLVKARQNVEAVELLKKLQSENRQATREEQAVLAKFIGWGASDLANNIFGPQDASGKTKLDRQLEALENYDEAIRNLGDRPYLTNARYSEYRPAFELLQSKNQALDWYTAGNITKAMLDAAKPDASARKWGELRDRLKAVLTPEEFKEASKSTQYAHYTSKSVVSSILSAVEKMGFKGGTILEPGAGIGVFPGLMQTEMGVNSVYTGIEMDSITGGILKQLFPDERILVESFIDSKLPENFYDVAIGNPPFSGQVTVLADPKYAKHAFKLHDYFFAKTIDSVKPGGLVVFVTSRFTMDKKADKARAFMAERADLVGAIRLPQTAFQKNAGTEVVTDVLFLRKKVPGETFAQAQAWSGLSEVKTEKGSAPVNEYFAAHPEMVLGSHSHKGSMYGPDQYTVLPREGDIEAHFAAAVENLPADVFVAGRGSAAEAARVREMDFNPKAKKEGSFYVTDAGVLMQREGGVGVRADAKHQKNAEVIKDYVLLRDAVKQTQFDQLNDGDWESSLKVLQKAYADFNGKHGRLLQNTTYMQKVKVDELDENGTPTGNKVDDEEQRRRFPLLSKLKADAEWTLVAELERLNEDTGEVTDSKWLTERTLNKPTVAEVKTPADALLAVLNDTGRIDIAAVADRVGLSEQETVDSLGTLIYEDPAQGWVMADEYLSGNVKKKLAQAEEAAKSDKAYARNVEALKEVQPAPRSPEQITPQIGMNWIPGEVYEQFLKDVTGVRAKIEYVKRTREWVLTTLGGEGTPQATSDWGVGDKAHAGWLMDKALSGAAISLNKSVSDGKGGSKQVFDPDRTEAANQKRAELRAKFREWLFQDAQRTTDLVQLYNDKFNTNVQRKFDGTHLTLPGTSKLFKIFDHVKRGAWRVIQTGNTYLAHAVGSGKTFEMVISAMEQKRMGLIKKPLIIVPGHMLQQFASEWQQLYPTARLMVADETDFHTDNRRRFVSRVAMSDLDGVIMTHSSFGLLDLDPVFKQKMLEQELDVLRASYEEAGGDLDEIGDKKVRKEPKIKRIEAQIEKLEQQLAKAMSSEGKDKNVRFDEMGVDFLYVDEAHLFRKLSFATARDTKGIDPNGSQMAWDLYMKTRWLAEKNPTRNLVMASGTAITNTTAELYTVQRYMAPQVLEENGLAGFDDWASQFGEESTTIESTASGKYEPVTRFQNFVNVGEMTQMFRDFADVLNEDHLAALLGDARPKVKGGARKSIITPKTAAYAEFLKDVLGPRIATSRAWKPTFEEKYNPDPIIAINIDARLAAIDMRFMDPTLPSDPDSKLNQMIDGVIRIYKETENNEYRGKSTKDKDGKEVLADFEAIKGATQMVFFESGFGKMVAQRRGFNARAWMEKRLRDAGIPPNQLAFMEDYKKSSAKLKLFSDVNKGKVRVLVGSSAAMGTGVNAQQRLIALHHLDAPYVPATLEQREGRIVRQGNKNPEVQIYAYSMFGSFDENMWSMLARKKFFIEQAMSGDPNIRSIEDVGEVNQLQMAAGLIAENPFVLQHAGAKAEVEKLTRLYRNHEEQRARHRADYENAGRTIDYNKQWLPAAEKEAGKVKDMHGDAFTAKADGKAFDKRKEWGEAILAKAKDLSDKLAESRAKVGEISGFDVMFVGGMTGGQYVSRLDLQLPMPVALAHGGIADPSGMATRAVNALVELQRKPDAMRKIIAEAQSKRQALESRLEAAFPLAEQLANKIKETADFEQKMLSYGKEAKPRLFSADDFANPTTMFSRGTGLGMSLRDLQAVVDRIAKGFKNLPRVHVMESPAGLSAKDPSQRALRDFIRKSGAWDDVEGATHEGEIYLFASGMADEARAEFVLAEHEVTHYGLRGTMGKELDSALQYIYLFNSKVRVAADKMKKARGLKSNVEAVEEVLADMPSADLAKLRGWRKVVQVVRNWLNKAGAKNLAERLDAWMKAGLTDQEKADLFVADLVSAARQWVKSGKNVSSGIMGGTRLADPRLADDLAAQEKWLEREAKMRGYKSIDELAEKDYPVFENLAALWRKKHPVDAALLSRRIDAGGIEIGEAKYGKHPEHDGIVERQVDDVIAGSRRVTVVPTKISAMFGVAGFGIYGRVYKLKDGRYLLEQNNGSHIDKKKAFWIIGDDLDAVLDRGEARLKNSDAAVGRARTSKISKPLRAELEEEFGKVFEYEISNASNSSSFYITHKPSGIKIRISDHDLPSYYENTADIDLRKEDAETGEALQESDVAHALRAEIARRNGAPTPSVDPDSIGSRSLGASRNEMQERPAVRADETGSLEEPAQSGGGAGSGANIPRLSRTVPPAPTSAVSPTPQARIKQWKETANRAIERMDNAVNGMGKMPDQASYLAERYRTLGRIAQVDEIAGNIRDSFSAATPADKKAIYDYLTTRGATSAAIQNSGVRDQAEKTKKYIGTVGDQLVQRGLIPQESREEYRDRYLPRLYLAHLLDDSSWRAIGGGKKASDMGYLKERNDDLPEEYRKVILGEVTDPAFLAASAIAQPMRDMAILDWLGKIVGNENWVWPKQLIEWGGRKVSAHWLQAEADALLKRAALYESDTDQKKAEAVATEMRKKALAAMADMPREHADYKRIPDTPRYGQLRGLMVRREIYDDLVGLGSGVPGNAGFAEQLLGQGGIGSKATQLWKTAKVALNPPGQIRNFVSNAVMLQLSGVPLRKIPGLIVRAAKQIKHGGKHWQAAKKYGVTAATFTAQELYRSKRDLLDLEVQMNGKHPLIAIRHAASWVMDKAGDAYQFSEALMKTAKMIDAIEREGMTEEQAALEAQKWLFDYSLVNRNIRYLRNAPVGMPFLTYSAKVAPRLAEVAAKHPLRFLPWVVLFYGMGAAAMAMLGGDGDDWDELKKSLPEWLRKKPHAVPLPWRDSEGRIQFTDIGYFFPWSQWAELVKDLAHGEPMDAMRSAGIIGGPVPDIITAIKTGIDPFTKKPIADPADPTWQQSVAVMNYAWSMAAPPFLTSNGFLSPMGLFDKQYGGKLVQGVTGTTDKWGDPRATTEQAFIGLAGVNIKGVDPDHTRASELQRLNREALDVKAKLVRRLADRSLSETQRTILISDYTKEMQERVKKVSEYGNSAKVPAFSRPIGGADAS